MKACPICGEEFDNYRQVNGHMNKHKPKPNEFQVLAHAMIHNYDPNEE